MIDIVRNFETLACPLCNGTADLRYSTYPGYKEPNTFKIFHCSKCNTSFSMPRIDPTEIYELIYKYGSNVRWYDIYWRHATMVKMTKKPLEYLSISEASYWAVINSIKRINKTNLKRKLKILEVGCGLGYLTYSLNKSGFDTIGLDISMEAVTNARKNFGNYFICEDIFEYSNLHLDEFDVIILTEVIEHLDNISTFMERLLKMLKPDGKIIITTPNKSFYPSNILWATDLPPVHYWWLSENSILQIFQKFELSVSFVDFKKFYARHPMAFDIRKIEIPITPPVFDREGMLLGKSLLVFKNENHLKKILKKPILFLIAYIKILRVRKNHNFVIPRKKGPTICAIIEKAI